MTWGRWENGKPLGHLTNLIIFRCDSEPRAGAPVSPRPKTILVFPSFREQWPTSNVIILRQMLLTRGVLKSHLGWSKCKWSSFISLTIKLSLLLKRTWKRALSMWDLPILAGFHFPKLGQSMSLITQILSQGDQYFSEPFGSFQVLGARSRRWRPIRWWFVLGILRRSWLGLYLRVMGGQI